MEQTAILRELASLQFLSVVETKQTSSNAFFVISDSHIFSFGVLCVAMLKELTIGSI